jgi:hypothetical protein
VPFDTPQASMMAESLTPASARRITEAKRSGSKDTPPLACSKAASAWRQEMAAARVARSDRE